MNHAVVLIVWGMICFFLGTFSHENDMARNCARDGDAHAWFNEIKCEKSK